MDGCFTQPTRSGNMPARDTLSGGMQRLPAWPVPVAPEGCESERRRWLVAGISPARGRPPPKGGGDRETGEQQPRVLPSLPRTGHGPGAAETRPRHPIAPRRAVPGSYADCY
jgi:hypothetical protein